VEAGRAGQGADRVGDLLGVGDDLDHQPKLVRGRAVVRLQLAHHAVATVHPEMKLVRIVGDQTAQVGAELRPHPLQDVVELRDQGRVAHAGQADGTVADQRSAFELDEVAGRGLEDRAGDPHRAIVDPLERRLGQVEVAAGCGEPIRV